MQRQAMLFRLVKFHYYSSNIFTCHSILNTPLFGLIILKGERLSYFGFNISVWRKFHEGNPLRQQDSLRVANRSFEPVSSKGFCSWTPLGFENTNMYSHILAHVNIERSEDRCPKLQICIWQLILDRHKHKHKHKQVASTTMNCVISAF
jgi:hypothetical protein